MRVVDDCREMKMFRRAVFVLLYCLPLISGVPADLKCLGTKQNGQIYFKLLPDITKEIHNCDSQWLVNGTVAAICDSDGYTEFKLPVINATAGTAIMYVGHAEVKYSLICPQMSVDKRLPCSYLSPGYPVMLDPLPENKMENGGFPDWAIAVIVTAVFLSGVIIFIYMKVKKKPEYVPAAKEPV